MLYYPFLCCSAIQSAMRNHDDDDDGDDDDENDDDGADNDADNDDMPPEPKRPKSIFYSSYPTELSPDAVFSFCHGQVPVYPSFSQPSPVLCRPTIAP